MQYKGINIRVTSNSFFTDGLRRYIWKELSIPKDRQSEEDYLKVLIFLIDYICQSGIVIKPNETITYHSWMLKFVENDQGFYEIWEAKQSGNDFRPGVDHSITVTNQQMDVCLQLNTTALFPTFNQKIAISKGVYEGLSLEAIRYPSPSHMCGWWLITDEYDDDIKSLMIVHFYHIAFKRPDVLRYLALPFGYRFFMDANKFEAWLDEEVKMRTYK
jgi:hypothetical protein